MRINLGCGYDIREGWINVDKYPANEKVIKADMSIELPFRDMTIDYIFARQCIEHSEKYDKTMEEIWRILKWGGEVEIIVPHFSHYSAYMPEHKTFFSYGAFDRYFHGKEKMNSMELSRKVRFKKVLLRLETGIGIIDAIYNVFPMITEMFLCKVFPVKEMKVILRKV